MWEEHFQHLGDKYIAAGDYNSKHTLWGSRITTPRGRTLEKYIRNNNLNILSTGRSTYWPTDLSKIPHLLDFAVTKGLNTNKIKVTPSLVLSSDHTPVIITYRNKLILHNNPETLCNKTAKWETFKEIIEGKINRNIPLKTPEHIEQAVTTVTPRGLPQAVFSNRRSRPYSVAGRSSYLTAGSYTMYRQAHSCRQAASSRNVEFCPLRFPHKNGHTDIRDHRRERWRDPSRVGVVFKMRQRNHRKTSSSFWRVERYTSKGLTSKFKPITSRDIVKHWVNFL